MNEMTQKHPAGLYTLFLTEMWERFGFYVAQGLLVLYMLNKFGFKDTRCFEVLGAFTALAYLAPVVGGYIADKMLGFHAAVVWGAVMLCIGYVALAFANIHSFYFALAIIVLGTGFLKPNVSSIVGTLYTPEDKRRDSGFTIFYIGINLGIVLSTLSSGFVHNHFGWKSIFGLASVGMIIGLVTFITGSKKTNLANEFIIPADSKFVNPLVRYLALACIIVATLGFSTVLMADGKLAAAAFVMIGILLFGSLFFTALKQKPQQRAKTILLLLLTIVSMFFWGLYFQLFTSLTLFIDRDVERHFLGFEIPTVTFLALISIYIVIFGTGLTKLWITLKKRNRDLSLPVKFAWAMLLIGFGFLAMVVGTYFPNAKGLVLPIWILLGYFLVSMGELFLSPIGLSMITELAPQRLVGVFMGVWFFSLGVGGQMAGTIAEWAAIPKTVTVLASQIALYRHAFLMYAIIGISLGLLIYLIYGISKLCGVRHHHS